MKPISETPIPIHQFPIPWSNALTTQIGSIAYQMERTLNAPVPSEWLGLVSSHSTKHGYASQDWQESLLAALRFADRQGWGVMCAYAAPYSRFIIHACRRFQVPYRVVDVVPSSADRKARFVATDERNPLDCGVLWLICDEVSMHEKFPIHDIASVFLAHHLFVLELKEGGKMAQLLDARLHCKDIPPGSTYLSLARNHSAKTPRSKNSDWLRFGAVGWLNTRSRERLNEPDRSGPTEPSYGATQQPIFSIRLLRTSDAKYLVHCTRSRRGPWPDQSMAQFHDELLQRPWKEQPSVFESLQRILQLQRIIATNGFRGGGKETVCFSSNEINHLLSMRRFQTHLARWDWEPYGIMIDRDWLERNGAKQVSYIDRATANRTDDEALAYCQVLTNDEGSRDWRTEREWRIAGDVRLAPLPFSKAIVFVPTLAEARMLQSLSRWPIAIANTASGREV